MHPRSLILFILLSLSAVIPLATGEAIVPSHSRRFVRYDNCEFVPTAYTDGDSFRVRIGAEEFVFRLYYVDAPESDERFPDRNAEQVRYFGIMPAESLAAGSAAKEYVRELLTGKKFTVFTRWASALESSRLPRYYAIVELEGRGLAELLVENGFARLHGISVIHPNGTKADAYIVMLSGLERSAKANGAGAWANSRPDSQQLTVEETGEPWEMPRWVERTIFAGIGGFVVGGAWLLTAIVRR